MPLRVPLIPIHFSTLSKINQQRLETCSTQLMHHNDTRPHWFLSKGRSQAGPSPLPLQLCESEVKHPSLRCVSILLEQDSLTLFTSHCSLMVNVNTAIKWTFKLLTSVCRRLGFARFTFLQVIPQNLHLYRQLSWSRITVGGFISHFWSPTSWF